MPANVVKTQRDEHLWQRAKAQAAERGRGKDYAYIMGVFKRMSGDKAMVQAPDLIKARGPKVVAGQTGFDFSAPVKKQAAPAPAAKPAGVSVVKRVRDPQTGKMVEKPIGPSGGKPAGGKSQGGPFIGPRGGKWADPKHTIPWQEGGPQKAPAAPQQAPAGWSKTADGGYSLPRLGHEAKLSKDAKGNWQLSYRGQTVALPKKGEFGHAEAALSDLDRQYHDKKSNYHLDMALMAGKGSNLHTQHSRAAEAHYNARESHAKNELASGAKTRHAESVAEHADKAQAQHERAKKEERDAADRENAARRAKIDAETKAAIKKEKESYRASGKKSDSHPAIAASNDPAMHGRLAAQHMKEAEVYTAGVHPLVSELPPSALEKLAEASQKASQAHEEAKRERSFGASKQALGATAKTRVLYHLSQVEHHKQLDDASSKAAVSAHQAAVKAAEESADAFLRRASDEGEIVKDRSGKYAAAAESAQQASNKAPSVRVEKHKEARVRHSTAARYLPAGEEQSAHQGAAELHGNAISAYESGDVKTGKVWGDRAKTQSEKIGKGDKRDRHPAMLSEQDHKDYAQTHQAMAEHYKNEKYVPGLSPKDRQSVIRQHQAALVAHNKAASSKSFIDANQALLASVGAMSAQHKAEAKKFGHGTDEHSQKAAEAHKEAHKAAEAANKALSDKYNGSRHLNTKMGELQERTGEAIRIGEMANGKGNWEYQKNIKRSAKRFKKSADLLGELDLLVKAAVSPGKIIGRTADGKEVYAHGEDILEKKKDPKEKAKSKKTDDEEKGPGTHEHHRDQALAHLQAAQAHATAAQSAKQVEQAKEHKNVVSAAQQATEATALKKGNMTVDLSGENHILDMLERGEVALGGQYASLRADGRPRLQGLRGDHLKKGTIYQGEVANPERPGGQREEMMRAAELAAMVEYDPDGTRGNGGLSSWFTDAYQGQPEASAPVNLQKGKRPLEPQTRLIDDDTPYGRALRKSQPQEHEAGLIMRFTGQRLSS